jgi:hypothetical protein
LRYFKDEEEDGTFQIPGMVRKLHLDRSSPPSMLDYYIVVKVKSNEPLKCQLEAFREDIPQTGF